MTEDDGLDIPTPRPRGRPPGARDSYPRDRTRGKLPKQTTIEIIMPRVRELIQAARLAGYHNGLRNAGNKSNYDERADQQAVDEAEMKLLTELRRVIDEGD